MAQIFIVVFLLVMNPILLMADCNLSTLGTDSWCENTLNNGYSVSTSQTDLVYDEDSDCLFVGFGAHPPSGGYPQINFVQKLDLATNTWSMIRPQSFAHKPG